MTRAQRRTRARTRDAASAGIVAQFRQAPAMLTDNPNRGKRHGLTATARTRVAHDGRIVSALTPNENRRIVEARKDYRPLTVHTPIARARKAPRTTSYTI